MSLAAEPVEIGSQERQLMAERARVLAAQASTETQRELLTRVLVVVAGDERFGVPVDGLREMILTPPITPLPGLPLWMPGVANTRAGVVCVVDLGRWFGATAMQDTPTHLVIVEGAAGMLALGVSGGEGFRDVFVDELAEGLIEERDSGGLPIKATTNDLLTVLDLAALFDSPQICSEAETTIAAS